MKNRIKQALDKEVRVLMELFKNNLNQPQAGFKVDLWVEKKEVKIKLI